MSDFSKRWDKDRQRKKNISLTWKNFISGFIMGGFTTIIIMYFVDTIARFLFG